jgi:hypothetical protein
MAINVDREVRHNLLQTDQTFAQSNLKVKGLPACNGLEVPVLGAQGRKKWESSKKAEIGAANRIYRPYTALIPEN